MSEREAGREWREVLAREAIDFATGKSVVGGEDTYRGLVTVYNDGTAMRVWFEDGYELSELTWEPGRLVIEVADAPAAHPEGGE